MLQTAPNLERVGDYGTNLVELAHQLFAEKSGFSDAAVGELKLLTEAVTHILHMTVAALHTDDAVQAAAVEPLEETIDDMVLMLRERHLKRLKSGECSVTLAAQSSGFNDISYFSREFKKLFGIKPSEIA